jgi:hypothetical protein
MGACSHGPDEAPEGVTVAERPTTEQLAGTVADGSTSTGGAVPCYGDGVTGSRIQAVYAHAADVPSRYADVVSMIGQWAGVTDKIYRDSAAETGGIRHLRWVTDPSCNLSVLNVQLSNNGDDDLSATINELQSLGLNKANRHYMVWTDATVYCGIGTFVDDDRVGSNNGNNTGPAYARVDSACWGKTNAVEAHEIMHGLGGVQYSAPHSSGGGHCTDDYDRMCYADSSSVTMTYPCPASHERLFDCGHDDYFHTSPPPGHYCSLHWNAANSVFLEQADPTQSSPSTTAAPTTSTTAAPTTTTAAPTTTTVAPTTTTTVAPTTTTTTAPPTTSTTVAPKAKGKHR